MKKYLIFLGLILFPFVCNASSFEAVDVITDPSGNIVIENAQITDLTASSPVETDSDKVLKSGTKTGSGSKYVMDSSPTVTAPTLLGKTTATTLQVSGNFTASDSSPNTTWGSSMTGTGGAVRQLNATITTPTINSPQLTDASANTLSVVTLTATDASMTTTWGSSPTGTSGAVRQLNATLTTPTINSPQLTGPSANTIVGTDSSFNTLWGFSPSGTGAAIRQVSPTLTTPTINSPQLTSASANTITATDGSFNTMWGLASTGTGGPVRATSPIIISPSVNTSLSSQAGRFIPGSEIVTNGNFTTNTSGWTASQSTIDVSANGQSGNCLQITHVSGIVNDAYQSFAGVSGNYYLATGYVKSGTSGDESWQVFTNDPGVVAGNLNLTGTSSATWVKFSGVFRATAADVRFTLRKNTGTAGTMYFDTISITELPMSAQGPIYATTVSVGRTTGINDDASFNSQYSLDVSGNTYITGYISVDEVRDRTPAYTGDALTEIKAIKSVDGKVDHTTLPPFARRVKSEAVIDKTTGKVTGYKDVSERDLGAMISIYEVAIKQLLQRIEALEAR